MNKIEQEALDSEDEKHTHFLPEERKRMSETRRLF